MASFEKQPNGVWKYRIVVTENGRRKTQTKSGFRTKKEAQMAAAEIENQLKKGNSLTAGEETFANYFNRWFTTYREGKFSWQNDKEVRYAVKVAKDFFQNTKLKDIDRIMYQNFLNGYGIGRANATVKKVHQYAKMCLRDALNDGVIFRDPTYKAIVRGTGETKNEYVKFLNDKEADLLMKEVSADLDHKYPSKHIILFGLATGCRFSEIIGMTWDCIDFINKIITINKTWDYLKLHDFDHTKNNASIRTINIDDRTLEVLRKLKMHQKEWQVKTGLRNKNNLVFVGRDFKPNTNNAVNKVLKRLCKKINIKIITTHALRHTHASILLYKNLNIKYISRRLGHGDIITTLKTYGHILDELEQRESKLTNEIIASMYD